MFDQFSEEARDAIVTAQETARSHGANRIGTVHLLAALRGDDLGPGVDASTTLARLGLDDVDAVLEERFGAAAHELPPIPFDAEVKRCLEAALTLAGSGEVGTGHLLQALS